MHLTGPFTLGCLDKLITESVMDGSRLESSSNLFVCLSNKLGGAGSMPSTHSLCRVSCSLYAMHCHCCAGAIGLRTSLFSFLIRPVTDIKRKLALCLFAL